MSIRRFEKKNYAYSTRETKHVISVDKCIGEHISYIYCFDANNYSSAHVA